MSSDSIYKNKTALTLIVAVFLVSLDRLFKVMAFNGYFSEPIPLIGNFAKLTYEINPNIAFSIPVGGVVLNILIFIILFSLIAHAKFLFKSNGADMGLLISATILGASSNLYDRMQYGFVIDYIGVDYFTVFNLADVIIFFSIATVLYKYK